MTTKVVIENLGPDNIRIDTIMGGKITKHVFLNVNEKHEEYVHFTQELKITEIKE